MTPDYIPIAAPVLNGNEQKYVTEAVESNWISAYGRFIGDLESGFASFCGTRHAMSCVNGTAALHLALAGAGVDEGDEVLVPTLTFVATANAVTYCRARPIFVDSEESTWNLDPMKLAAALTPRTKAIVPVHLYGHLARMDALREFAAQHDLVVVEDAAEALGAGSGAGMAGNLGHVASFSLFGNKIITTGEGGVVVTSDDEIADRVRLLRGQGMDLAKRYWFVVVGHNYRMTNLVAAVGLGQLEKIEWHLAQRRSLYEQYVQRLAGDDRFILQQAVEGTTIAPWLFSVRLRGVEEQRRDEIMQKMHEQGIETRPVFYPMHVLPPYRGAEGSFPVAEAIAAGGITLPLWAGLTPDDIDRICDSLVSCLS
jgi:perosamine synthetase